MAEKSELIKYGSIGLAKKLMYRTLTVQCQQLMMMIKPLLPKGYAY